MHFVYIIQSKSGKFEVGHTQDVQMSLEEHNENRSPTTGKKESWNLITFKTYKSVSAAIKVERKIRESEDIKSFLKNEKW